MSNRTVVAALGSSATLQAWVQALGRRRLKSVVCDELSALMHVLERERVGAVLIDGEVGLEGAAVLELLQGEAHAVPVVWLADQLPPALALALINRGLGWTLPKQTSPEEAAQVLRLLIARRLRAVRDDRLRRQAAGAAVALSGWGQLIQRRVDELVHELKTPAAIVQGFCANLLDELDGPLAPSHRDTLQRMRGAIDLLVAVLAKSRERLPQGPHTKGAKGLGARRAGRQRMSLESLVEQTHRVFQKMALSKDVTLHLELGPPLPSVWADPTRLSQLLVNLLGNALRHTPQGEQVALAMSLEPPAEGRPQAIRLSVSDTGSGIAPEQLDSVFERGWSGVGRSGLGLAICRQIAVEHQAELTVESALGRGTTFHLLLPVDPRLRRTPLSVCSVQDPALVGQLFMELRERAGWTPSVEPASDMEQLAQDIIISGGKLILAGEPDARLTRALQALSVEG